MKKMLTNWKKELKIFTTNAPTAKSVLVTVKNVKDAKKNNNCVDSNGEHTTDMKCMRRKATQKVPGCDGRGVSGKSYCYNKKDIPSNSKNIAPVLSYRSKCKNGECGKCEGPCNESDDCKEGLRCTPGLVKSEFVPGCGGFGLTGKGYCFDYLEDRKVLQPLTRETVDNHVCKGNGGKCPQCQGPCDPYASDLKDDNCEDATLCFRAYSTEAVPGCGESPFRPTGIYSRRKFFTDPFYNILKFCFIFLSHVSVNFEML